MENSGTYTLEEKYIEAFNNALNKLHAIKNIAHKRFLKGKKQSEANYCNQMMKIKKKESELKIYLCALKQVGFDLMHFPENIHNDVLKNYNDSNLLRDDIKELLAFEHDKNDEIKSSLENKLEDAKKDYQNTYGKLSNKIKESADKREEYNNLEEKIAICSGVPLNMLKKEVALYVPRPKTNELLKYAFEKKISTSIYPVYPEIEFYDNCGFCLLDNGDALFVGGNDSINLFQIHFDDVGMVKILPLLGDFDILFSHLGQGALINNNVYFFGSCQIVKGNDRIYNSCLKIDLKSYQNTRICDFPEFLYSASTQVINNQIWIAHARSSKLYKYNTLNNTYSLFVRNLPDQGKKIINKILIKFKNKLFVITSGQIYIINLKNDRIENSNTKPNLPASLATYPVNRGKYFYFVLRNGDCLRFNCLTINIKKLN